MVRSLINMSNSQKLLERGGKNANCGIEMVFDNTSVLGPKWPPELRSLSVNCSMMERR